jgi:hypothetical protein
MLRNSNWLSKLSNSSRVQVWASSAHDLIAWDGAHSLVKPFPVVHPFKEFPYNYLRRLNEFAWDFYLKPPSRLSIQKLVRNRNQALFVRSLKLPGWCLAMLRLNSKFERKLEQLLLSYERSSESRHRLNKLKPELVVTTGPHRFEEPAVISEARKLNIPVLALITSWDNLSTKNRMVFKYDGYIAWSAAMKADLVRYYPHAKKVPIYVTGAPQFDVFKNEMFYENRTSFFDRYGLDPEMPLIVYGLGSPNFLKEHHGAVWLANAIKKGQLPNVQMIVRPHPLFDNGNESKELSNICHRVIVQDTGLRGKKLTERTLDNEQVKVWVNTFRHANVVVNLSSTVAIDAALYDKPVVNLDFDPEPGTPNQQLVKDVNHVWTHFKPVAESGGVWLVNNYNEMVNAINTYLQDPDLHKEKRRRIAEYVCGYLDGRCGERVADAIIDFIKHHIN